MSDIRKEQEREELHKTIWGIADDLRGSVDGWDFKSYVLGMMFYRYISENLTNYINAGEAEAGNPDFDYAKLSDEDAEQARADLVNTKGFFILPSELFVNVRARAVRDENLNETLEKVFKHIEESATLNCFAICFPCEFCVITTSPSFLPTSRNIVSSSAVSHYRDNRAVVVGSDYSFFYKKKIKHFCRVPYHYMKELQFM